MNTLRSATQNILNNTVNFPKDIAPAIENVAERAPDEWSRARIRKLPVVTAFSHCIAVRAMARIDQGEIVPSSEDAYEKYLSLTEGLDRLAGQEMVDELNEVGGTFSAAIKYFKTQTEITNQTADTDPELIQKRGKIAYVAATEPSEELHKLLISPIAANARGTTMSLIIGEAIRVALHEGHLPESHELGQELRHKLASLADLTQQPAAVFQLNIASKEVAKKSLRQIRQSNKIEIHASQWPAILKEALTSGQLLPAAQELGQPPHDETRKSHKLGHCAAQLYLQPYEYPGDLDVNRSIAIQYFLKRGLSVTQNSFRTVDYQLLRATEVAENTLFTDPACRVALEAIAHHIQR